jgi:hypothetical protein
MDFIYVRNLHYDDYGLAFIGLCKRCIFRDKFVF